MSSFETRWDPLVLVEVMRAVLAAAQPAGTGSVTQRAYGAARVQAGYADTPRADKLVLRFGLPWGRLVAIVSTDPDAPRTIARATSPPVRSVLTEAETVDALQTAAQHLGASELSPARYEQARRALNAATARRHLHGRAAAPMPSVDVIREKFSFAAVVADAGLAVAARREQRLMTRAAAVTLFIEHCGFVPRQLDLRWFASHHGMQLVDREHERHRAAVAAAAAEAGRLGRWFPTSSPTALPDGWQLGAQADSPALARARAAFPAARKAGYSIEEVREGIRQAFDLLDPGAALTQERYRTLSVDHGLPSPSVIGRLAKRQQTSFGALVRGVASERAEAARHTPPACTHG